MAVTSSLTGRRTVIGIPFTWLFIFFFLPFLILLYISFVDMGNSIHPFKPLWDPETGVLSLKYENYWSIVDRKSTRLNSSHTRFPSLSRMPSSA
jgi:putrescine transport system permease protein